MSILLADQSLFTQVTPLLNPAHLLKLTDDTGLYQHCRYTIPDRQHGYTLDDNVRTMIVAARTTQPELLARLPVYVSFVMYCQRSDGLFRNFMGYDRHFLEEVGSFDSQGRTLWALGVLYLEQPDYRPLTDELIRALLPHLTKLKDLRAKAFAILGLHFYLKANPTHTDIRRHLDVLAKDLLQSWQNSFHSQDWPWFEEFLSYENARLPQALFAAYLSTGQKLYLSVAGEAALFLKELHFKEGYLKLVGNQGWYQRGKPIAEFDEQPVDAGALVEMYLMAYQATGDKTYFELAHQSFAWYLGQNCNGLAVYDPESGGCCDALTAQGVNLNQGAESVLSYAMALQSLKRSENLLHENSVKPDNLSYFE